MLAYIKRLEEREKLVTEHYNVMVRHAGNLEGKIIQLEANWNELKQWLISNDVYYPEAILFRETLHKMRELEGGSNE